MAGGTRKGPQGRHHLLAFWNNSVWGCKYTCAGPCSTLIPIPCQSMPPPPPTHTHTRTHTHTPGGLQPLRPGMLEVNPPAGAGAWRGCQGQAHLPNRPSPLTLLPTVACTATLHMGMLHLPVQTPQTDLMGPMPAAACRVCLPRCVTMPSNCTWVRLAAVHFRKGSGWGGGQGW
jgi:hypothetical protein